MGGGCGLVCVMPRKTRVDTFCFCGSARRYVLSDVTCCAMSARKSKCVLGASALVNGEQKKCSHRQRSWGFGWINSS